MKIEIIINKETAEHIRSPHTFYDCCGESEVVLKKVQNEINKKLK